VKSEISVSAALGTDCAEVEKLVECGAHPSIRVSDRPIKLAGAQTASLDAKIAATRAGRLATCPQSVKAHFAAAWSGKASPRRAIKAQCLDCVGFDRAEITGCTAYACSLWNFRPYQKS
jgi:hypothetical protein